MKKFENIYYPKGEAFKEYDFKNLETGEAYEVKADRNTARTGNIFIEYECNNKDSGINSTEADYIVYFVCNVDNVYESNYYYEIPVEFVKSKIEEKMYSRIVSGGDFNRVRGCLFNENVFRVYKVNTRGKSDEIKK